MTSFFSDDYMELLKHRGVEEREKFRKTHGRYPDDKEAERIARFLIEELKLGLMINRQPNKTNAKK